MAKDNENLASDRSIGQQLELSEKDGEEDGDDDSLMSAASPDEFAREQSNDVTPNQWSVEPSK